MNRLPQFIKRNARYRGQRESEKYLFGHQEQIFDIRQLWTLINDLQSTENTDITYWFLGENDKTERNLLISIKKTFKPIPSETRYTVINHVETSILKDVVVKLDEEIIDPSLYRIENNDIILDVQTASQQTNPSQLTIYCLAYLYFYEATYTGQNSLSQQIASINERLAALERSRQDYENARE